MPFVPYALSLSLTVAYRKWRFSRTPLFRVRGKDDFLQTLAVLEGFGKIWTSARINSNLGNMVMARVRQLEAESRSKQAPGSSSERPGSRTRKGTRSDQTRHEGTQTAQGDNSSAPLVSDTAIPQPADTSSSDPSAPQPSWAAEAFHDIHQEQYQQGSVSPSFTRTPGLSNAQTVGSDAFSPYPPPSYLGDLPFLTGQDATVFQSWDMADTVDNYFGSNLDLGNPLFWPGYAIDQGLDVIEERQAFG